MAATNHVIQQGKIHVGPPTLTTLKLANAQPQQGTIQQQATLSNQKLLPQASQQIQAIPVTPLSNQQALQVLQSMSQQQQQQQQHSNPNTPPQTPLKQSPGPVLATAGTPQVLTVAQPTMSLASPQPLQTAQVQGQRIILPSTQK